MSVNKSYFTAIAREFKAIKPPAEAEQLVAVWAHVVSVTASHFAINHGNFNREKFYEAAGMSDPR